MRVWCVRVRAPGGAGRGGAGRQLVLAAVQQRGVLQQLRAQLLLRGEGSLAPQLTHDQLFAQLKTQLLQLLGGNRVRTCRNGYLLLQINIDLHLFDVNLPSVSVTLIYVSCINLRSFYF